MESARKAYANRTLAIQPRFRRASRVASVSPSKLTGAGASFARAASSNVLTFTTAYVWPSISLVTTVRGPHATVLDAKRAVTRARGDRRRFGFPRQLEADVPAVTRAVDEHALDGLMATGV